MCLDPTGIALQYINIAWLHLSKCTFSTWISEGMRYVFPRWENVLPSLLFDHATIPSLLVLTLLNLFRVLAGQYMMFKQKKMNNVHFLGAQTMSMNHATLQWRHNERDGISNHRRLDCLLNRLFRSRSKKTPKVCITGLYRRPVNSPHQSPGTRKMSPFDDVIMKGGLFSIVTSVTLEIHCNAPM